MHHANHRYSADNRVQKTPVSRRRPGSCCSPSDRSVQETGETRAGGWRPMSLRPESCIPGPGKTARAVSVEPCVLRRVRIGRLWKGDCLGCAPTCPVPEKWKTYSTVGGPPRAARTRTGLRDATISYLTWGPSVYSLPARLSARPFPVGLHPHWAGARARGGFPSIYPLAPHVACSLPVPGAMRECE